MITERHEVVLKRKTTEPCSRPQTIKLIDALLVENAHGRKTVSTAARESLRPGF